MPITKIRDAIERLKEFRSAPHFRRRDRQNRRPGRAQVVHAERILSAGARRKEATLICVYPMNR